MKPELEPITAHAGCNDIAASCGKVAVECSAVGGFVQSVIDSSANLRREHEALRGTITQLEDDHNKVAHASDEARVLSERAINHLGQGAKLIHSSIGCISEVLTLVDNLVEQVTAFSGAMERVRKSSKNIEQIAETTNILALNASIEAMRAGEAGRTFAVVADEVKGLAAETHRATTEIDRTLSALEIEASSVVTQIESSFKASQDAKNSIGQIERTIGGVAELVEEVDQHNDQIARSITTISCHVDRVQNVLGEFDNATRENEKALFKAFNHIEHLELTASDMFDGIVKAGLSPNDSIMVDIALSFGQKIGQIAESAIAAGVLRMETLFDHNYILRHGTNPPLYRTSLSDWADINWRPVLDSVLHAHAKISICSVADMNGFLPTHLSQCSQMPTGDVTHDTKFCRNGRKILDHIDKKAKNSADPYMMSVYRHENDGKNYEILRGIYVPVHINGFRWGDFELYYIL